jgi:hypothetical protein
MGSPSQALVRFLSTLPDPDQDQIRQRAHNALAYARERCLEWQDGLNLIWLSLLSGRHCLLIGNPGIAKSHTLRMLLNCIQEWEFYRRSCTSEMKPQDFVGWFDIKAYTEEGKILYKVARSIVTAKVAMLQEFPRLNGVTKEALLPILNKETFHLMEQSFDCDVIVIGDGNVLEERVTGLKSGDPRGAGWACYDRMLGKKWCAPFLRTRKARTAAVAMGSDQLRRFVEDDPNEFAILRGSEIEGIRYRHILPMVQEFAGPEAQGTPDEATFWHLIDCFRKAGVRRDVGDRWALQGLDLMAADAWMRGKDAIDQQSFKLFRYLAPEKEEHLESITKVLQEFVDIGWSAANKEIQAVHEIVAGGRRWLNDEKPSIDAKFDRGGDLKAKVTDSISALKRLIVKYPDEIDEIQPLVEQAQVLSRQIDVEFLGLNDRWAKAQLSHPNLN